MLIYSGLISLDALDFFADPGDTLWDTVWNTRDTRRQTFQPSTFLSAIPGEGDPSRGLWRTLPTDASPAIRWQRRLGGRTAAVLGGTAWRFVKREARCVTVFENLRIWKMVKKHLSIHQGNLPPMSILMQYMLTVSF